MPSLTREYLQSSKESFHFLYDSLQNYINVQYAKLESLIQLFLFKRELYFSGLALLSEASLLGEIPETVSNLTWKFGRASLTSMLLQNPLVKEAKIEACSRLSMRCFQVELQEREPSFVAAFGETDWVVAKDGSLIEPTNNISVLNYEIIDYLPRIENLSMGISSSALVKSRSRYLADLISDVEEASGEQVKSINFDSPGEVLLSLHGFEFKVKLSADNISDKLAEREVNRLAVLLEELEDHLALVQSIDLVFDRIGVVRFIDS